MVNDARIAAGKSTIGFINPTVSETPGNTACRDKAFPVDLFLSVRWCLQRYYHGKQPRMWNQRIQRHSRLGPCDWSRNAQLAQAAPSLARASLRDRDIETERVSIGFRVLFLILCARLGINLLLCKARDSTCALTEPGPWPH